MHLFCPASNNLRLAPSAKSDLQLVLRFTTGNRLSEWIRSKRISNEVMTPIKVISPWKSYSLGCIYSYLLAATHRERQQGWTRHQSIWVSPLAPQWILNPLQIANALCLSGQETDETETALWNAEQYKASSSGIVYQFYANHHARPAGRQFSLFAAVAVAVAACLLLSRCRHNFVIELSWLLQNQMHFNNFIL